MQFACSGLARQPAAEHGGPVEASGLRRKGPISCRVVTGSPLPQSLGDSHTSTSPGQPDGISLRVTSGGTGAQAWSVKPLTNVILAQSLISLHYFLGQSRLLVLPASISSH